MPEKPPITGDATNASVDSDPMRARNSQIAWAAVAGVAVAVIPVIFAVVACSGPESDSPPTGESPAAAGGGLYDAGVPGKLLVVIKGECELYLNGNKLRDVNKPGNGTGKGTVEAVVLREGDVFVIRARSRWVYRAMRVAFLSSNGRTVLPFRRDHFRLFDDKDVALIDATAVAAKKAKPGSGHPDDSCKKKWAVWNLPADDSQWMWGAKKNVWLLHGCVIQRDMFKSTAAETTAVAQAGSDAASESPDEPPSTRPVPPQPTAPGDPPANPPSGLTKPSAPAIPAKEPAPTPDRPDPPPVPVAEPKPPTPKPVDPPPKEDPRRPLPDYDAQQQVTRQLDEIFELDKTRTKPENLELAKTLYKLGKESRDKPDERFVLYRRASEVARDAGDAKLMLMAVDQIGAEFQIDTLEVKVKSLIRFAAESSISTEAQSLITSADWLIDRAMKERRYDLAVGLIESMYQVCLKPHGRKYRKDVYDRRTEVLAEQQAWEQVSTAFQALEADPDDPNANLQAGRWHCFVCGDWKSGLPHLAKCSDPALASAARQDLANPQDTRAQVQLGNDWAAPAQTASAEERERLETRAVHWYRKAIPRLNGLQKLKVEKLIKALDSKTSGR